MQLVNFEITVNLLVSAPFFTIIYFVKLGKLFCCPGRAVVVHKAVHMLVACATRKDRDAAFVSTTACMCMVFICVIALLDLIHRDTSIRSCT